ncbi:MULTISPECIES: hypothetical protein [Virgibacillus]|uniref:Uncharacterized protein n=1 Tax=Virgibacillus salinus TaxID=553311 RepID=A0A1H1FNV1_9BACI|nr:MULTISPECIES: hypothetical protein [Virgibacillus]SDR02590.1 hypothetical protein SAMN05216231_3323 [Virgibacillus salinus]
MIKIAILICMVIIIVFNFLLLKRSKDLLMFYMETIAKSPYLSVAKELHIGQQINLEYLSKQNIAFEGDLIIMAVSVKCSTCKEIINGFEQAEMELRDFVIVSNGVIPIKQKTILLENKIKMVESEEFFNSLGLRSVPRVINIDKGIVTNISRITHSNELSFTPQN